MDATQERRKQHSDQMLSFMKRNNFPKVRKPSFSSSRLAFSARCNDAMMQ
jgi:hypothetical protein